MSDNLRTVLALSRLPGVGRTRLRKLLGQFKVRAHSDLHLSNVLEQFRDWLPPFSQADIDVARQRADETIMQCESLGISVRPYGWPSYPPQLGRLVDPPALLFSIGEFEFTKRPRIAVIGTRNPTKWGLRTAEACAAKIIEAHGVVVSGLALGIDTAAHAASIHHGGPTWAILAHGLHQVSPSSNRELAKQIVAKGGCLISEYAPGEHAQRHYFVERDRIQAGLSDAILVIESGIDGGSMHTVKFAEVAHMPVWITFPQTKIHPAEIGSKDLPEPQQGTWNLLRTGRGVRVPTVKVLGRMLADLMLPQGEPSERETLFTK